MYYLEHGEKAICAIMHSSSNRLGYFKQAENEYKSKEATYIKEG